MSPAIGGLFSGLFAIVFPLAVVAYFDSVAYSLIGLLKIRRGPACPGERSRMRANQQRNSALFPTLPLAVPFPHAAVSRYSGAVLEVQTKPATED